MTLDRSEDPEELFAAWAVRAEAGESVSFEELLGAHLGQAEALRRLHADWQLFAPLLGRAVPGKLGDSAGIVLAPITRGDDDEAQAPSPKLLERLGIQAPDAGRYRFRALLGRGGGGVVLKVWDTKLNRPLAMKVVLGRDEERPGGGTPRVDGRTLTRFVDEARIASQLNHPGIVPVHELGADESGRAYFTMKLVKGEDLAQVLEHVRTGHDGWNPTRALGVLLRVCESVAFAHEKGVIHRDLKPANVMVGRHGEVYVMDWGLARVLGEEDHRDVRVRPQPPASALLTVRSGRPEHPADSPLYTMDGDVVGTPAYMAPEQAAGRLDRMGPHSDVYAVGAMIYHLLAGHMPYVPEGARLNNYAVWQRVQEGPPPAIEQLAPRAPLELVAICEKAMAREVAKRYRDMPALANDLRAFLEGRVVSAYETGAWAETRKWVRRHRALAASLAAAISIALAGVFGVKAKADEARSNAERASWNAYTTAIALASGAQTLGEPSTVRRMLDAAPEEHRGWEWGYLNATSDTSMMVLRGHRGEVNSARYSPDGTLIVTASDDRTARIWDAETGKLLHILEGHTKEVIDALFSPDGRWVATSSSDHTIRIWDSSSGIDAGRLVGHAGPVRGISFSKDGELLLSHSDDKTVRLWDVRSRSTLRVIEGEEDERAWARFSPDGRRVVSPLSEGGVLVWEARTGDEIKRLAGDGFDGQDGHWMYVRGASFNSDGSKLVTFADDHTVRTWDVASGVGICVLDLKAGNVDGAEFCNRDTRILTWGRWSRNPRLWNVETGEDLGEFEASDLVDLRQASILPWWGIAARASDHSIRLFWSEPSSEHTVLRGHLGIIYGMDFRQDRSQVVTASADGTARVWDLPRHCLFLLNDETHAEAIAGWPSRAFEHDGRLLEMIDVGEGDGYSLLVAGSLTRKQVAILDSDAGWADLDGAVIVDSSMLVRDRQGTQAWDLRTGVRLATFRDASLPWYSRFGLSPDGRRALLRFNRGDRVHVCDLESGAVGVQLEGIEDDDELLWYASFDPKGTKVVASNNDIYKVWDLMTGGIVARLDGRNEFEAPSAFSPDGTRLVTVQEDRTAVVWDTHRWTPIHQLEGHAEFIYHVTFSQDGSMIAVSCADGAIRLWSAADGSPLRTLVGATACVTRSSFSPDGSRILAASADKTLRVYDVASGLELTRLVSESEDSFSAEWTESGRGILLGTDLGDETFDSVPRAARFAEREAVKKARPEGERVLEEALAQVGDLVDAGDWISEREGLDATVRRAALDLLLERSQQGRAGVVELEASRSRRDWTRRITGLESRPVEAEQPPRADPLGSEEMDAQELRGRAWDIVNPDRPRPEDSRLAITYASKALESDREAWHRADCHRALAWAFFWEGRFDKALEEGQKAIAEYPEREEAEIERLQREIAKARDEQGNLRVDSLREELARLEARIAELEADRWVQAWIAANERRRR